MLLLPRYMHLSILSYTILMKLREFVSKSLSYLTIKMELNEGIVN